MGIGIILSTFLAGSIAFATEYRCVEAQIRRDRPQYAVYINELSEIRDPRIVGDNDFAKKVRVSIYRRRAKPGDTRFERARAPFEAIAKGADVVYRVDAPRNGLSIWIYLEDLLADGTIHGLRGKIRFRCTES